MAFDEFLRVPTSLDDQETIMRTECTVVDNSDRFRLRQEDRKGFERQYAHIYFMRLSLMSPMIKDRVAAKWPGIPLCKILEIKEGEECAVIGTLYKEMKLKPSILDEYTKEPSVRVLTANTKFVQDTDAVVMEDEGARMTLRGSQLPIGTLATGMVVAVRGVDDGNGAFCVSDICHVDLPPQHAMPRTDSGVAKSESDDPRVAILSGLGVGASDVDPMPLHLAVDYLTGMLGSREEQAGVGRNVVACLLAGNLLEGVEQIGSGATEGLAKRAQGVNLGPLRELDAALTQLSSAMPVALMPGGQDPTNYVLPQQPFHRCMVPAAATFPATFFRCPNPADLEIAGVSFVGTSGQNVDDLWRSTTSDDRLVLMESLLRCRHLAPTAPDTLAAYPFADKDPFVLHSCPNVFFAGNQPAFGSKVVTGADGQRVRVVAVPRFRDRGEVVLVNLRTLEAEVIGFRNAMAEGGEAEDGAIDTSE